MNIVVLVKQVPDSGSERKLDPSVLRSPKVRRLMARVHRELGR